MDDAPSRQVGRIVLVCAIGVLVVLALLVPAFPVSGVGTRTIVVPLVLAPFPSPIQSRSDVLALVLFLTLVLALLVPPPLLVRALVTRRPGRVARVVVVIAAVGLLLWGIFFLAASTRPLLPLGILFALLLALIGILLLAARATVLARVPLSA